MRHSTKAFSLKFITIGILVACQTHLIGQEFARDQVIDYMEQLRVDHDLPGISVAVAGDGKIVFSEGVGYAELDNRTPATGRTVHNIGSVSKVFAVVGLMQLVEAGSIDLDATLQQYMSYYPEQPSPITIRHILTHTSGIRHYRSGEFGPYGLLRFRHYDSFEEATRLCIHPTLTIYSMVLSNL